MAAPGSNNNQSSHLAAHTPTGRLHDELQSTVMLHPHCLVKQLHLHRDAESCSRFSLGHHVHAHSRRACSCPGSKQPSANRGVHVLPVFSILEFLRRGRGFAEVRSFNRVRNWYGTSWLLSWRARSRPGSKQPRTLNPRTKGEFARCLLQAPTTN